VPVGAIIGTGCRSSGLPFDYRERAAVPREVNVKYLCLVHHEDPFEPDPDLILEFRKTLDAMTKAGVYRGSAALQPASSATTLRMRGDDPVLTDGPYAEIKEQVGGFFLLECPDLDEAIRWAATIPGLRRKGSVEIRPILLFGESD
jgi:hypothetical protein